MGSSSSKAVRKLPTSATSAARSTPAWAGARTPHPNQAPPPDASEAAEAESSTSGTYYGNQPSTSSSTRSSAGGGAVWHDDSTGGNVGSSSAGRPGFSGEKDDGEWALTDGPRDFRDSTCH